MPVAHDSALVTHSLVRLPSTLLPFPEHISDQKVDRRQRGARAQYSLGVPAIATAAATAVSRILVLLIWAS
jgi:hypothetical protein